jgi:S1-C subfamily serine protease
MRYFFAKLIIITICAMNVVACTDDPTILDTMPTPVPVQPIIQADGSLSPMNDVVKAIVQIGMLDENRVEIGWGSGTIIDPRGLIVTNFHVVGENKTDTFNNSDRLVEVLLTHDINQPPALSYYAQVVAADPDADLAILRIVRMGSGVSPAECLNLPTIPVNSADLGVEESIKAVGYPSFGDKTITITTGKTAGYWGIDRFGYGEQHTKYQALKVTAPLSHGVSGGALLNDANELVGVPTFYQSDANGAPVMLGGAVPISLATYLIELGLEHPFPGCDEGPITVLQREPNTFPKRVMKGKVIKLDATNNPAPQAEAFVYLFPASVDVNSMYWEQIIVPIAKTQTSGSGEFAVPNDDDQLQQPVGVVIVVNDKITMRENNVKLFEDGEYPTGTVYYRDSVTTIVLK